MGLPESASAEEPRQLIEGKLQDDNHEPQNVQVIISETRRSGETLQTISLMDESGMFMTTEETVQPLSRADLEGKIRALEEEKEALEGR